MYINICRIYGFLCQLWTASIRADILKEPKWPTRSSVLPRCVTPETELVSCFLTSGARRIKVSVLVVHVLSVCLTLFILFDVTSSELDGVRVVSFASILGAPPCWRPSALFEGEKKIAHKVKIEKGD